MDEERGDVIRGKKDKKLSRRPEMKEEKEGDS
jgi:hypothetical protein